MVKVKVKQVVEADPEAAISREPLIVNFEHGQVNPQLIKNARNVKMCAAVYESKVPVGVSGQRTQPTAHLQKKSHSIRRRVAVVQTADGMTYLGSSDNSLNKDASKADGSSLRNFIAVRRRKKLYVYEANSILVSPYLQNYDHLKVKDSRQTAPKTPDERRAAAIDLVKAFGSKKKRLNLERQEKQAVNSQHMNDSINTAANSASVPTSIEDMPDRKDTTVLQLVPPCNRETTNINQVYLLKDILTDQEMEDLDQAAIDYLNYTEAQLKSWREKKTFSDYFFEMLKKLVPKKNDPQIQRKAKIVLYTEVLICLLKLKFQEVRKKNPALPHEFPPLLIEKALDKFTTLNAHNLRCRAEQQKDKTCCYIMVLVLLANDYVFDVQLMSTSLQIHIKKLLTLAKAVGITVQHNAVTKEYRGLLKFPLPKPIERRGRAKNIRT